MIFLQVLLSVSLWCIYLIHMQTPSNPSEGAFFYGWKIGLTSLLTSWWTLYQATLVCVFLGAERISVLLNPDERTLSIDLNLESIGRVVLQCIGVLLFNLSLLGTYSLVDNVTRTLIQLGSGVTGPTTWPIPAQTSVLLIAAMALMAFPGSLSRFLTFKGRGGLEGPGSSPRDGGIPLIVDSLKLLVLLAGGSTGLWFSHHSIPEVVGSLKTEQSGSAAEVGRNYNPVESKGMPTKFAEFSVSATALVDIEENGACPALLAGPKSLAVAPDGDVYVADLGHSRISVFNDQGIYLFSFGTLGPEPGKGKPGEFNEPSGVAVGPDGTVYVADTWNERIQKFDPKGTYLGEYSGPSYAFYSPRDVAVDNAGILYVADTGNSMVKVIDQTGKLQEVLGGSGDGRGQFKEVFGMAVNSQGELYVADSGNRLIHKYSAFPGMHMEKDAKVPGWEDSSPNWPQLAIDKSGNVFLSDGQHLKIFIYDSDLNYLGTINGALSPRQYQAQGIAFAANGDLWVSDVLASDLLRIGTFGAFGSPVNAEWNPYPVPFPQGSIQAHAVLGPKTPLVKDDFVERRQFVVEHDNALRTGQFSQLDSEAIQLRASHTVFDDGDSKLLWFYSSLSHYDCAPDAWNADYYVKKLIQADQWDSKYPDSVTAKLYRAQVLVDYAWQARGSSMADGVSKEGWMSFGECLRRAWNILDQLANNPEALKDPEYYCLRVHAAYGLQRPEGELETWYLRGHKQCPEAWELTYWYTNGIAYKWSGSNRLPAFFRSFIKEAPVQAIYVAAYDDDISYGGDDASGTPWDKYEPDRETFWNELLGAARTTALKYGTSAMALSRIAKVAANTGHFRDAEPIFRLLGERYEVGVWRNSNFYDSVKEHCLAAQAP
jgi:streptogramin lyase